jgi:hypothetical protein
VSVSMLTKDHSPDREDEQERIKECGGVIMTSSQYDVKDDKILSLNQREFGQKRGSGLEEHSLVRLVIQRRRTLEFVQIQSTQRFVFHRTIRCLV